MGHYALRNCNIWCSLDKLTDHWSLKVYSNLIFREFIKSVKWKKNKRGFRRSVFWQAQTENTRVRGVWHHRDGQVSKNFKLQAWPSLSAFFRKLSPLFFKQILKLTLLIIIFFYLNLCFFKKINVNIFSSWHLQNWWFICPGV